LFRFLPIIAILKYFILVFFHWNLQFGHLTRFVLTLILIRLAHLILYIDFPNEIHRNRTVELFDIEVKKEVGTLAAIDDIILIVNIDLLFGKDLLISQLTSLNIHIHTLDIIIFTDIIE